MTFQQPAWQRLVQHQDFWPLLKQKVKSLNDDKYKRNVIGGETLTYRKEDLSELDAYFNGLQAKLDKQNGTRKNMPYTLNKFEPLELMHRFNMYFNSSVGKALL